MSRPPLTTWEELEASLLQNLDAMEAECAAAIEEAHIEALSRAEDRVRAAELEGRQRERQRVLLLIAMELEHLKEGGRNALALQSLRRRVIGESER